MSYKKSILVNRTARVQTESLVSHQPKHMHRRSISKTSAELQETLKNICPSSSNVFQVVTPQIIKSHFEVKGIFAESSSVYGESSDSDDEINIRNIIEKRKSLSPNYLQELKESKNAQNTKGTKKQEPDGVSCNTGTTTFTSSEESNLERIVSVLEKACMLPSGKNGRKTIVELMQKSPEPHFALILDEDRGLRGIYYVEVSTGFFHRVLGISDTPYVIPPRRVKQFLHYDQKLFGFVASSSSKFDAVIIK